MYPIVVVCAVLLGAGAADKYAEVHGYGDRGYGDHGYAEYYGDGGSYVYETPKGVDFHYGGSPYEQYNEKNKKVVPIIRGLEYGTGGTYGYDEPNSGEYHYGGGPHGQYNEKPKKKPVSAGYNHDNSKNEPYNDGYKKSWKILRSEKIETETIDNPDADNPGNRYIVKSTHKVREKLPYQDTTVGYDHEYAYPISEVQHDLEHNEKVIDFNSAKTDPFYSGSYDIPKKGELEDHKPKKYTYFYKYPSSDIEYDRNVQYVNAYLNKGKPKSAKYEKKGKNSKKYDFDVETELSKPEKYQTGFDHSPSEEEIYRNYKTDGPSYGYF